MEQIVPWAVLCKIVEPDYPMASDGRPPVGLERVLRMHFAQYWFHLVDAAGEDAPLVGIDPGRERVADDATTLLKFRGRLAKHQLGEAMFAKVVELLQADGRKVGTGTIVDATIIRCAQFH